MKLSRRTLFQIAPLGLALNAAGNGAEAPAAEAVSGIFPTQPPELATEVVGASHGNVKRVRELVEARPSLAKAAWDWGFGDWETALGAASHVGNREIAEYLIGKGAHPTIFSAAMLGHLEVVKMFVAAQPGVQKIAGPHSIPLLAHAKAGGAQAVQVLRYLEELGDAGSPPTTPLTEAEAAALTGIYVFGSGPTERIEITAKGAVPMFTRQGRPARGLVHLGDHAFHPIGAAAVRVRFSERGGAMELTVHDPDVVLTAKRG